MSQSDVLVEPGLQTPEPSLEEMLKEMNESIDKDGIIFIPPKAEKTKLFETAPADKGDKWKRIRYCACSPTSGSDCRFHSPKEKGWEVCPALPSNWLKSGGPEVHGGKWLYAQG